MATHLPAAIVRTLEACLATTERPVPLHEPHFGGQEWTYVKECLDTGWVSSVGRFVDRFEEMLQELTGAASAVAVVNGTAGLQLALHAVGVDRDDEVLIPALTFAATANAVHHLGAVPHLVDASPVTLGVDPTKLDEHLRKHARIEGGHCVNRTTARRIAAIVPVHVFGHPVDLDPLREVSDRHRLRLVEDAAESIGSTYKGRHTGTFGKVGVLSFNGNKTLTTGGGGALLTNDPELGKLLKHLSTTAKVAHRWRFVHDHAGFNYRLPNLNAALGCAQLEQLSDFVERKRRLATIYRKRFRDVTGVTFFDEPSFAHSNYWLNALLLDAADLGTRNDILDAANDAGFMLRPAWDLVCQLSMYAEVPRMDLSVCEDLVARIINLPSSPHLAAS